MTQASDVRAWAREQGFDVGVRGRIAPVVWDAYAKAHDGFRREDEIPGLWNCRCGRQWSGLREAHCMACHKHFSTPANFDAHRPHGACVDPLSVNCKGYPMKVKASIWGPIYVIDNDHYRTVDATGLYDDDSVNA